MKKFLPLIVVGLLVLSGFGAVAINVEKEINLETIDLGNQNSGSRDYTHTVFVEVGTATWCPACPASNLAWHSIYEDGQYNFEYSELVVDKNSKADAHMQNDYNLYWVPTSYFDGGQFVEPGTEDPPYYNFKNNLDSCGSRTVPDIVANLDVVWIGETKLDIRINIKNNEETAYPGHLRVYIIELESTLWKDYNGNPYYHPLLDFAFDQEINIPAGGTYIDSTLWDGPASGFPGIINGNIQVILVVFDDEAHQSYSDPPSGAPFSAYYADETIAFIPTEVYNPPGTPEIDGPPNGKPEEEYEYIFKAVDPDDDDVKYHIDWDDGNTETTDFNPSDTHVLVKHTWNREGTFTIKVQAEDTTGLVSPETTHEVIVQRNRAINTLFLNFLKQYLNLSPLLQMLLQRFGLQ